MNADQGGRRRGGHGPSRERFRLTFEALPDDVGPAIRLRRLLKYALRTLRLRCRRVDRAPDLGEGGEGEDGSN
jgi:hypothetical protein